MMSHNQDAVSQKHLHDRENVARAMPAGEELDDPMQWSKEIQDQLVTYCEGENECSCFGNCMRCYKVGITTFLCMCQEGVHFVCHIFQQALPQEDDPPSRQVLDPIIWAGLHGQLGANAYTLHLMQPKDFLPPLHWGRDAACSHQFLTDKDKDLINAKIAHMLSHMDRN
jgi:hypothetical protein